MKRFGKMFFGGAMGWFLAFAISKYQEINGNDYDFATCVAIIGFAFGPKIFDWAHPDWK